MTIGTTPLKPFEHVHSQVGLEAAGISHFIGQVFWNLNPAECYEQALRNREAILTADGALRVRTGQYTGRSPKDKFIVEEPGSKDTIWWGSVNTPISEAIFERLHHKITNHLSQQHKIYVLDTFVGADPDYRLPIRIITEAAYHALFSWNMFIRATPQEQARHVPEFTVMAAPSLFADPEYDGTRTGTFILLNFAKKMILIGGTLYSGEVKKGIFSVMNYLLPQRGVMPMHCSANEDKDGNTAVFFGLSGTGKTTLSADSSRTLIGDDEHGWSDRGVFNFEGGCYAKTINLSPEKEPEIYATTKMFGTILENVPVNESREPLFDDDSFTENTRCSYPIFFIPNASSTGMGGHPRHVIFLAADAFGVLPPISKLSPEQAMYHFISGYTAKLAGTERGVTEPQATFSACFGAPFMPMHPTVYAEMLAEKIKKHSARVWLVNTGWTGGPYGIGKRIELKHTRRIVHAALDGELEGAEFYEEPFFGLCIPKHIHGVPEAILNPRNTWEDEDAYDEKARHLAGLFRENFKKFADKASPELLAAGPKA
ncbi:MAG: phosphoenolpyruvate carboxykinase (ATP) [Anaerolineae bacterium]|nr:phosphoenolpyruvate carboxykinase (ATP) [Anaerolineae bacterium]